MIRNLNCCPARRRIFAGLAVVCALIGSLSAPLAARAETLQEGEVLRPVNSAFMLEAGSTHLLDSYLSPLKYTGWNVVFAYERTQAMKFSPESWRQRLNLSIEMNRGQNPARNASLLYGNIAASWSMNRLWRLPFGVNVAAGGMAGADLGGVYSDRNSNNPATVKADLYIGATATVAYRLTLGKLPLTFRWQTSMPLLGVAFSPEYDELYYEIYLGNRHGLAHCAWPGNYFRWDNLLTTDIGLGNTTLRMGLRSRIYSSELNNITTRNFSYAFVLGVVTDWLSVSPRRGLPDASTRVAWAQM